MAFRKVRMDTRFLLKDLPKKRWNARIARQVLESLAGGTTALGAAQQAVAADNPAAGTSGVTSRRRLGGGLAAERQGVRQTAAWTEEVGANG